MTNPRLLALAVILAGFPACAPRPPAHTEGAVTAVLESFYDAIKRGDAAAAMSVIAHDAVFVESGKLETRAEYEKNHLPSDIAFEKQVTGTRAPYKVNFEGDAAWLVATTDYDGKFDGAPVSFVSAQLMVLTHDEGAWKIRSIHWSSRPRLD